MATPNDGNVESGVYDDGMTVVEYGQDGKRITPQDTSADDAPIISGNAWNAPVERPQVTEEQLEKIRMLKEQENISPDERLKQLINLKPIGFEDDAQNGSESPSAESNVVDANNEPAEMEMPPMEVNPAHEAVYAALGITDTEQRPTGVFDPDAPMDAPTDNREIKASVRMDAEEIAQRGRIQYDEKKLAEALTDKHLPEEVKDVQLGERLTPDSTEVVTVPPTPDMQSQLADWTNSVFKNNEANVDNQSQPAEESPEPTKPTSDERHPQDVLTTEEIQILEPQPDGTVIEEQATVTTTVEPPQASQPAMEFQIHEEREYLENKEDPEPQETPPPLEEPKKEPDPEPVTQDNVAANETSLQEALGGLPESQFEIGDNELTVDQSQKLEPETTEVAVDNQGNITTEDRRAALASISALHSAAIFGSDQRPLFETDDLDVMIENDIDPSHIVVPNMTPGELLEYTTQSDPDQLRRDARNLFGSGSDLYQYTAEGIQELEVNLMKTTSYPSRVHTANQQFGSKEAIFNESRLEDLKKEHDEKSPGKKLSMSRALVLKDREGNEKVVDDNFANKDVIFNKIHAGKVAKVQSTSSAKVAAMLIGGYRRVHLYHSGFNVQLCAPRMDLLSRYYNSVIDKITEFGRLFGQFSFLPAGVEKRAALFDLFQDCVITSNLVNFEEPDMLRRAVSSLDLPTIAWALASLMHPKGIDIEYLCYNNDDKTGKRCRHVEKAKIDINSMRYNNWTRMYHDQVQYVDSNEPRTLEDLERYRAEMYKAAGTDFVISKDGNWKATLHIPTFAEAENAQRGYIATMEEYVQLDRLEKVETYFRSKYYAAFAPYIGKITYIQTDADGSSKALEFEEPTALERALDNLQLVDGINLPDVISEYISSKTLTTIAYTHHPCPVCGKMPPDAVNGLAPCDPEYSFFVWTMAKLRL